MAAALFNGTAFAEEPLRDLVQLPEWLPESQRADIGIALFLEQEAGVAPHEIVDEISVIPQADRRRGVVLMRGTRFVDAASAERAALKLAARDVGELRPLGRSLGDGFVTSSIYPDDLLPATDVPLATIAAHDAPGSWSRPVVVRGSDAWDGGSPSGTYPT